MDIKVYAVEKVYRQSKVIFNIYSFSLTPVIVDSG